MPCEICGAEGGLVRARIEGTTLRVCQNCAKFGEVLPEAKVLAAGIRPQRMTRDESAETPEPVSMLVSDYGRVVKQGREKKGWSQEDLGKKINEKESLIRNVEHGSIRPPEDIVKKLERALGVRLREEVDEEVEVEKPGRPEGMTLGHFVRKI